MEVETPATKGEGQGAPKTRLRRRRQVSCRNPECAKAGGRVEKVALPFVFKYLVNELAAMNIRVSFDMTQH